MKLFDHPNIVFLVGACTQDQIVIVTELCKRGSLFDCMHKARVLFSQRSLWRIMREIAVGPSTATVCCCGNSFTDASRTATSILR
mmetsp:Transcript_8210/g.19528  ORF Transcript_8210/g.19528 Transcript_8210/m.19528 type:complete len:85 (-) Transcript_8210:483-737(-)